MCSNAKIRSAIVEVEGGLAALVALGWQQAEEEGEAVMTLPKGGATMAQVGVREGGLGFGVAAGGCGATAGAACLVSAMGCCCCDAAALPCPILHCALSLHCTLLPTKQVRTILEAQQEFKKTERERVVKRSKSSASLTGSDRSNSDVEALR